MTATIVDLEDFQTVAQQTFLGQYDEFLECPASWDFTASGDTYYVGALDEAEFTAWLYATMAPLGFTP